jgi:CubicO group peptidase (beta-lactamase class C family)
MRSGFFKNRVIPFSCAKRRRFPISGACTVFICATAALSLSCRSLSSRVVYDPNPSISRLQAGDSNIRSEASDLAMPLIERGESYGFAVGVLDSEGNFETYGFGKTGLAGSREIPSGDTIFEVGSLSKLFVTSLLEILVREGTLRYDDTVRSILPSEVQLSDDAAQITLYELVTQTSGLPRQPTSFTQLCYFIDYLFTGDNLYRYIDRDWLYEYLRTCELKPKGEREYVYSNLGMGLLTHLIEVKTGRKFADLASEKIFRPLHMNDTTYTLSHEQKARLAVGHTGDQPLFRSRNSPLEPWDMGEIMNPSGGLYSTVNDLMIFARANLGLLDSSLVPTFKATQTIRLKTPDDEEAALGWIVDRYDNGRFQIAYKHGMVAGYNAYIGFDINTKVAVVVLCNTFNWNDKVGHNLVLRIAGSSAKRQTKQVNNN